ncbi:MAG: hypothetical protein V4727_09620 [Verrucomicrobiota bacterium]
MHPELQILLKSRLNIIADHAFRDRDPDAHLEALKSVSLEIDSYAEAHRSEFDGKLRHYLSNSSYQKALEHLSA